ncbi:sigma-70 family RNA polymerase sigma factor [Chryseobacterium sp. NRRL B-14859]|uniref:RNA polymerase sigma factor n=1 Tax=unclassified Chryseobacterium TaxID=2593645 RepID=UPI000F449DD1|nr:sigma-70 family RNA polymerase sigma factor [Chryseobacterium sp. G0240]ROI06836.1 sigma-70 family RNA polymerase sigma factor [Chryseobacterium sp. G0240]
MSSAEKEFLEKIEKHKGVIFKISKMYMDNKDDQNDLYQEIIYQAWKSYGDFQKRSDFSTWLYRTALNTAIVFLRSEKKRSFIRNQNIEGLSAYQEPYNDTDDQNMKLMYEAIHQLSPIDKALIFFFLEDFSGKEIALQLGITEVNARVKLKRAKEKLKEIIARQRTGSN